MYSTFSVCPSQRCKISKTLASGSANDFSEGKVRLWDVATRQVIGQMSPEVALGQLGFRFDAYLTVSPDGKTVAVGNTYNGTIRLWDITTGQSINQPIACCNELLSGLTFSPNGKTLASSRSDGTIRLWDTTTGQSTGPTFDTVSNVWSKVVFSPDGSQVIAPDGAWPTLFDVKTGKKIASLQGYKEWLWTVAVSPDGKTVAGAGGENTVWLWDVASQKPVGTPLVGHTHFVTDVVFSPDGNSLASIDDDGTIRLWDLTQHPPVGRVMSP